MPQQSTPHYIDHIDIDKLVRDGVLNRDEAEALLASHQAETGTARMEALPSTAGDVGESEEDKDTVKEAAMKHKRHWVRVTRLCNQRCTFCLDSMNQDGTMIDVESLKAYIALGRRMGRERLILSGGEASVHPEFLELIRYGKQVGYDWIQTITNGMMFSYQRFAKAAAQAGLNEATVSMHGHTAHLHDKLTGTPGAFVTGIKGIQNLQQTGQVVVNVDVVINKQNYKWLPEIIEYYYNLGIREFDLLHIIPFGRGFDEHRHSLFFDLNDAVPYFRRAFLWANKPGLYLWTNRLPVTYMEGAERLIQDPHKLFSEFDGGRHNFEGYLKRGLKPDCHGERCDYCFLDGPCRTTMFPYREHLEAGTFPVVKLDSQHAWQGTPAKEAFDKQAPQAVWLTARSAEDALTTRAQLGFAGAGLTVQLDAGADPQALYAFAGAGQDAAQGLPIRRFVVTTAEDAGRYLVGAHAVPAPAEVEVRLTRELAAWLLARPATLKAFGQRLVLALRDHEFLSESQAEDPEPATLAKLARTGARMKNVPKCMAAGSEVEPHDHFLLDAKMLDAAGHLSLDRYVEHYIDSEYYAKSIRCGRCAEFDRCKGVHINYLRNHGFAMLTPLDEAGVPLPDAASFEAIAEKLKEANAARSKREQQRAFGLHKPGKIAAEALSLGQG
jgi:pyruvate-formate lyase-activating enzyme